MKISSIILQVDVHSVTVPVGGLADVTAVLDRRVGTQGLSSWGPIQGQQWVMGQIPLLADCGRPRLMCHCLNWQHKGS